MAAIRVISVVVGAVLSVVGVVWILQGANVIHGSGMSGHGGYAVLGAVVLVVGAALLAWSWWRQRHMLS
jgi:drug/metabolite transporter (DMT)-like permease